MKHLKEEFDKLTFKETIIYSLAVLCIVAGFVLLFLGLYIPPTGEIHESVLTAFGLILVFVGSLLGISMHYRNKQDILEAHIENVLDKYIRQHGNDTHTDNTKPINLDKNA